MHAKDKAKSVPKRVHLQAACRSLRAGLRNCIFAYIKLNKMRIKLTFQSGRAGDL